MGENARSRRQLVALGVLGYGLVFAGLCLLQAPAIAIAAYFVIPTALVAIAGGPIAGAGAAMFSMLLFLVAAAIGTGTTESTGPASSATARLVALVFTGMLVGWFAERNRALVADLRLGAERDHLTGLGNHRFFDASLGRRLESGGSFALLLCDMDRLKDVNDGQGHSAGDDALRALADGLRALARSDDEIARIGGDEFCLIAAVRTPGEADAIAARMEDALASVGCPATFGWATHPRDGHSQTELFRVADGRLYARKATRATKLRVVS